MLQLTPLHYRRQVIKYTLECIVSKPIYGKQTYTTDCGRFNIHASPTGQWFVYPKTDSHPYGDDWLEWLTTVGLYPTGFPTRRDMLEVLTDALKMDGLMDAHDPTVIDVDKHPAML